MLRLDGKVAFVTGAGGGIGSAICRRFLEEGARVAAVDLNVEAMEQALRDAEPGQALPIAADAGDSEQVRDAIARAAWEFGLVNVLCNVAGGSSAADGPVTEAPEEEFWRVIRLDLFGPFVSCRHGIPRLIEAGGGSVINMTSMTALVGTTGRDCYTAAKGGVAAITRSMAVEFAGQKVRVNAIAPGMTLTPRVAARRDQPEIQEILARHLLGAADPIDIAEMAVYLASDESRVVTGQVMRVDSGVTIH
ncbi:SDR family oxidoreductase [Microbacterium sp. X-17]|uniref:SDR family NAD(P)-dependent oxidoreductase n=1 Tax=Microbacterium sp. X-17 TaxID=3144404 RepID=UPI0031F5874B